jgi:hypothetical protein
MAGRNSWKNEGLARNCKPFFYALIPDTFFRSDNADVRVDMSPMRSFFESFLIFFEDVNRENGYIALKQGAHMKPRSP